MALATDGARMLFLLFARLGIRTNTDFGNQTSSTFVASFVPHIQSSHPMSCVPKYNMVTTAPLFRLKWPLNFPEQSSLTMAAVAPAACEIWSQPLLPCVAYDPDPIFAPVLYPQAGTGARIAEINLTGKCAEFVVSATQR